MTKALFQPMLATSPLQKTLSCLGESLSRLRRPQRAWWQRQLTRKMSAIPGRAQLASPPGLLRILTVQIYLFVNDPVTKDHPLFLQIGARSFLLFLAVYPHLPTVTPLDQTT